MVVVAAYAWMVGGGASVVRATLMAETMLAARALDHRSRPFNAMAVAGAFSLAANPMTLFDPGTWLTYGASFAIVVAAMTTARRLAAKPAWVRVVAGVLTASTAAELALFPVSAFVFSRVTAAGLLVNFAAIPLMTVVQIGGDGDAGGRAGERSCGVGCRRDGTRGRVGARRERAPGGPGTLADAPASRRPPGCGWPATTRDGRWLLAGVRRARARDGGDDPSVAGCAVWILWAPALWWALPRGLRVTVIDVGQGDAILVQSPSGQSLLVDAGGAGGGRFDIGGRVVAPVLWSQGVRRLDLPRRHPR